MTHAARRAGCLVALAVIGISPGIGNRVSAAGRVPAPGAAPPGETTKRKTSIAAQGVTILSWPSRFSRSTSFVLKGKRTISVRLHRCLDEECKAPPLSNVLSADVELR